MNPDIIKLQNRITELEDKIDSLFSSSTIPIEVDVAIRDRFLGNLPVSGASAVTVASKTQAVNEAGSASYSVAKPMTAIIQVKIGASTYNFADYT